MGTNYYLHTEPCPCCGKPRQEVHLGKSSYGWKFLIHKTRFVKSYKSLCKFIKQGVIKDEYDTEWSAEDFLDLIQSKQDDKEHPDAEHIGGYDFLGCDFC